MAATIRSSSYREIIPVKEGHGDVGQDHRVPGFQGEGGKVEEEGVIR